MSINKIDRWKTFFKSRLILASSIVIVSSVLAGCGAGAANADKSQDDNAVQETTVNESSVDENLEEKIKSVNEDQLEKASEYYKDELNILNSQYGQEYAIEDKSIEEETDEAYLNGNKNYQCTIVFQVSTNNGRDHHWYNLKVIIENDVDGNEVKPLGYTAREYGLKYGEGDSIHWIALDKDNTLTQPVPYGSEEHKAADNNSPENNDIGNNATGNDAQADNEDNVTGSNKDSNSAVSNSGNYSEWQYFNVKDDKVSLKGELSELPKSEVQDAVNELYAIKGYQFTEEPYKSRYPNGTITDKNQIQFTDEEKSILDRLSAYAEGE